MIASVGIHKGDPNIFAELGLPDAGTHFLKAKIVAEGSPQELIRRFSTREVVELRFATESPPDGLAERIDGLARRVETLSGRLLLYTDDGDRAAEHVHELGVHAQSTLVRRSTLEDVFLYLTGRMLVDE